MNTTELLKHAADFIEENKLNLYAINISPHRDFFGSTRINLQGDFSENKKFYNKNKLPFESAGGFLCGKFDNITVTLSIED